MLCTTHMHVGTERGKKLEANKQVNAQKPENENHENILLWPFLSLSRTFPGGIGGSVSNKNPDDWNDVQLDEKLFSVSPTTKTQMLCVCLYLAMIASHESRIIKTIFFPRIALFLPRRV